jgi:hypothetical protein
MKRPVLFSIIESPMHPDFSALYRRIGIDEIRIDSMRKALAQLKKQPPDFIVAEFFYGYGNNYAGVNISNLDVLLYSLQKYAPQARVIVLVEKSERVYVDKLNDIIPLHGILLHPLNESQMATCLDIEPGAGRT